MRVCRGTYRNGHQKWTGGTVRKSLMGLWLDFTQRGLFAFVTGVLIVSAMSIAVI